MNGLGDILGWGGMGQAPMSLEVAVMNLLLAFVLGQLLAWTYVRTHGGLSYSRAFVQSIVMLTVIIAMGMMVIGNNIVIAFGLIGALAVIRFRNILKDTRDTAFIFAVLIIGMAVGTGHYGLAAAGTLVIVAIVFYLHWVGFGTRFLGDGFVRFQVAAGAGLDAQSLRPVFRRHCRNSQLVTQRIDELGGGDLAFRLNMRDPSRARELVEELKGVEGVKNVSFVMQEEQAEM